MSVKKKSFISLRMGKLYKKPKKMKLKNFPAGYVGRFYRNLADNVDNFLGSDFYGKIAIDTNIPIDVQKYILATSDFAKEMQTDINSYVTRDMINNTSFRHFEETKSTWTCLWGYINFWWGESDSWIFTKGTWQRQKI